MHFDVNHTYRHLLLKHECIRLNSPLFFSFLIFLPQQPWFIWCGSYPSWSIATTIGGLLTLSNPFRFIRLYCSLVDVFSAVFIARFRSTMSLACSY
jgi:predicted branched-subunit amino acid permease